MEKKIFDARTFEAEGYEVITTTSDWNGYPRNLMDAVIPETWEDVSDMMDEYDCKAIMVERRDGQSLWSRGRDMDAPFDKTSIYEDDDNIRVFGNENIDEATEMAFAGLKENDFNSDLDNVQAYVDEWKRIIDELDYIGTDEIVVVRNVDGDWEYVETTTPYCMKYSEDSHNYRIAIIAK